MVTGPSLASPPQRVYDCSHSTCRAFKQVSHCMDNSTDDCLTLVRRFNFVYSALLNTHSKSLFALSIYSEVHI
jgi:hypothetical protein